MIYFFQHRRIFVLSFWRGAVDGRSAGQLAGLGVGPGRGAGLWGGPIAELQSFSAPALVLFSPLVRQTGCYFVLTKGEGKRFLLQ